ncbi:MAG: class I SAM-dependent methyltransferase [Chitinophagales bacterium]
MNSLEEEYLQNQAKGAREIYERNKKLTKKLFNRLESVSGVGSTKELTTNFRVFLENIIKERKIQSISDCPCGDFNWMNLVDLQAAEYWGYDVVEALIQENRQKYPQVNFEVFNAIENVLPQRDLIIARDFLFHLSNESVLKVLANFKRSGTKYLITTSFDDVKENIDLKEDEKKRGWGWRKINVEIAPFNLGNPLAQIEEQTPNGLRLQKLYLLN